MNADRKSYYWKQSLVFRDKSRMTRTISNGLSPFTNARILMDRIAVTAGAGGQDHRNAAGEIFVHRNVANLVIHTTSTS